MNSSSLPASCPCSPVCEFLVSQRTLIPCDIVSDSFRIAVYSDVTNHTFSLFNCISLSSDESTTYLLADLYVFPFSLNISSFHLRPLVSCAIWSVELNSFRCVISLYYRRTLQCYSAEHLSWLFFFGFPMLAVYVFGIPAFAMVRISFGLTFHPWLLHYDALDCGF